jgi:site-specific recombinase XerD
VPKKTLKSPKKAPKPLFDTLENLQQKAQHFQKTKDPYLIKNWLKNILNTNKLPRYALSDYQLVLLFLYGYRGSLDTFNSYRRELERLIQWSWFIRKTSVLRLKNTDLENFIEFCLDPPKRWIATKIVARFVNIKGIRQPNFEWRPFAVKISKKSYSEGDVPDKKDFALSQQSIKALFNILNSFYNYLLQEELITSNPILRIRQKSRYIRKEQHAPAIRRLSKLQWDTVIKTAISLADQKPEIHERTLFIMNILYGMYLRISELAVTPRWTPKMCDFFRDGNGNWWFKTVGKGNKARQIAVSGAMLKALKRWRHYLDLPVFPTLNDKSPLLPKQIGKGPMTSTRAIRMIVQTCFDEAINRLQEDNLFEEAETLRSATVHWLRHTGISDDVKIRPREHVRDDAGHSSGSITDKYIDIELQERAASAKKKSIVPEGS